MKNCSFTGHRFIQGETNEKLEEQLNKAIDYVYSTGCRNFYCGGALGFDTMAAKILIEKRIKQSDIRIIIVVPCRDQANRWSDTEREMYEYILSSADEVIFMSDEYTKDCMRIRNAKLAEVCDVLIAYSGRAQSGSAQTVRMATSLGKKVYNLYKRVNAQS